MSKLIITTGSITTAVRLEKLLNSYKDINAKVIHTPSAINNAGCSYSVKTSLNVLDFVKELSQKKQIKVRKFYIEEIMGEERVYHAIS